MKLNIKKKIAFIFTTALLTATPIITTVACGANNEGQGLLDIGGLNGWDGVSHKAIEEDLNKINRVVDWKPANPFGDEEFIKKLNAKKFNKFFADEDFVESSNGVFQRSPRTILSLTPGVDDINDLDANKFGMTELKKFVESNNGTLKISLISGTEDDTNGTLGVKAYMKFGNKTVTAEYIVDGFTITKDIELNGDKFTSIKSIINALNKETKMDFEKKVAVMTPQDLKNELIDLYNTTYGGSLTIIGSYKGKVSAIALDRHKMLVELINAFGNVSKTKRYDGTWLQLGFNLLHSPGKVKIGNLVDLFSEYSKDLPTNQDKDDVAGLLGNLPADVMNMFPSLLELFSQVANGVKSMPMVIDWAKNTRDNTSPTGESYENRIKDLNHILVRWVLKTGNWK